MTDRQNQAREAEQKKNQVQKRLKCRGCGRKIKPETSFWEEDGGEGMYCHDCRAEMESCGCSD